MMTEQQPSFEQIQDVVYALASSPDALYAARGAGLYRSHDGGKTWHNTFAVLEQQTPPAAAAVAVSDQTVLAGSKGAILRSDDAGESWHITALPSPAPLVVSLVLSPFYQQDHTILAGTAEDGVFVSNDRGETWIPWNFGLVDTNIYTLAISHAFGQDHTVFAGTESGVFCSRNGGRSWREVPFPMEAAPVLSLCLSPDGLLYAGTECHGLFVSDDFGQSWCSSGIEALSTAIHAIHVVTQPDPQLLVLLEDKLLIVQDAKNSWHHSVVCFDAGHAAMAMNSHPTVLNHLLVGFVDGRIRSIAY